MEAARARALRAAGARQRSRARAASPPPRARRCATTWSGCVRDALAGEGRDVRAGEPWRPLLDRAEERGGEAEDEVAREREAAARGRAEGPRPQRAREASSRRPPSATGAARAPRCSTSAWSWPRSRSATSCAWRSRPTAPCWACDRIDSLAPAARGRDARRLREAVERCEDTRLSLVAQRDRGAGAVGAQRPAAARWSARLAPTELANSLISRPPPSASLLIRGARGRAGLTHAELAERAGMPQSTIARAGSARLESSGRGRWSVRSPRPG